MPKTTGIDPTAVLLPSIFDWNQRSTVQRSSQLADRLRLHFGHCDPETRQVGLQAGRWKMPPKTIPENTL